LRIPDQDVGGLGLLANNCWDHDVGDNSPAKLGEVTDRRLRSDYAYEYELHSSTNLQPDENVEVRD